MDNELNPGLPQKTDAEIFIGPRCSYYLNKWERYPLSYFKGWNWPAMIFGINWLVYRKMYLEALILLIATMVIPISLMRVNVGMISFGLTNILMGSLGNYLYWKKSVHILTLAEKTEGDEHIKFLKSKGGINVLGVVICNIIAVLLQLI